MLKFSKGADASQIDALDLSLFGNVRVDYFDDGEHITVSGFRLEPFKTHFETLGTWASNVAPMDGLQ